MLGNEGSLIALMLYGLVIATRSFLTFSGVVAGDGGLGVFSVEGDVAVLIGPIGSVSHFGA